MFRRPSELSQDVRNEDDEKKEDLIEDTKKNDELTGDVQET